MGRSIKRNTRGQQLRACFDFVFEATFKRVLKWMLVMVGLMILLGSCRTIDCGCPMAVQEKNQKDIHADTPVSDEE